MAKKRGIERDVWEVFLSEISRHGNVRKACNVAGVTRYQWRTRMLDLSFAEDYADAQEDATDRIEDHARAEAMDGSEKLLAYLLDVKRYKKSTDGSLAGGSPSVTITIGGSA